MADSLVDVAEAARPSFSPLPPGLLVHHSIDAYDSVLRCGYRDLAARAKHDPAAAKRFKDSHLWLDGDPVEACAILREHPLMKPALLESAKDEGFTGQILDRSYGGTLTWIVKCLAKLSVKEGGVEAARRWHRFLTAGADYSIPAHEITVFHGLVVRAKVDLGPNAYLASYGQAKSEFDLPEEPEPFPKASYPNAAVLVRDIKFGPGVAPREDRAGLPHARASFSFPAEYSVDLEAWFGDSRVLVDLLSIAARSPLLSRTRYVRLPEWIAEMDPNLGFGTQTSGGYSSDVWPRGRDVSQEDVRAFVDLFRGSYPYPGRALGLAIRRLAGSFSRPGGRFDLEDRVLDVAIALEILYGGTTGQKMAKRAARLLGVNANEQMATYDAAEQFYRVRSRIVHSEKGLPSRDSLHRELEGGQELGRRSLAKLILGPLPVDWARVKPHLDPEAEAHIQNARGRSR